LLFTSAFVVIWHVGCPTAEAGRRLEIPAWSFDRGNGRVVENPDTYADYRDVHPELVVVGGDRLPWEVQYDVDIPADATYALKIRYGSPAPRPIEMWLDGKKVATCAGRVTGDSPPYLDRFPRHDRPRYADNFHGAEWEEACTLAITKGRHTLKLTRSGQPPRLSALRLEAPADGAAGFKPTAPDVVLHERKHIRYRARARYGLAFGPADPGMDIERIPPRYRTSFLPPGSVNTGTLRLAIEDKIAAFGPEYARGPRYLKQLAALEEKRKSAKRNGGPEAAQRVEDALQSLRRSALLDHPLLDFDKLLFVKRTPDPAKKIYRELEGGSMVGNLCVLSPVAPSGKAIEVAPELSGGLFGRFDLSFDARRVVFSYKKPGSRYRIYETGLDPSTGRGVKGSLRQITFDPPPEPAETRRRREKAGCRAPGYDDVDPCYLPNGRIMFASTRSRRVVFCAPHAVTTLHVVDADGKNLRRLSEGPITEIDPCVMNDGRVVYMRWEYVDKGFGNAQSLWSVRPDGSHADHVYKNNVIVPGGMVDARSVPGSRKIVAVGVAHCGPLVGPVVLLDTRRTRRTAEAMTVLTPELGLPGMMPYGRTKKYGSFKEPYPLSEKLFLVAHNPHGDPTTPNGYGIYVLDAYGNRAALYRDPVISCFQPVPLRPRPRPTEIASVAGMAGKAGQANETKDETLATIFMQDVYRGMTGIRRGRVKYLRVMEAPALPWDSAWRRFNVGANLQSAAVSLGGDVHLKKMHGIVPVYEDGSACFTVPPRRNLYFQALDENYMELQRMRTFINLMPGEKRSCIGCHEMRRNAPGVGSAVAARRAPQPLRPQPGETGPRMIHYTSDVQPILDRHCVRCHSGEKAKGKLDLSGTLTGTWNRSYENLINKHLVSFLYGCYGEANIPAEPPLTFGSHRSTLVERIRKAPCKADLTREEFIRIVTWIDANTPYYGTHRGKKDIRHRKEPDFRPVPVAMEGRH
jgi:hypothetical protein